MESSMVYGGEQVVCWHEQEAGLNVMLNESGKESINQVIMHIRLNVKV